MLVINRLLQLLSFYKFLVICDSSLTFEEVHPYRHHEGITQRTTISVRDFSYKGQSAPSPLSIPIHLTHIARESTQRLTPSKTNSSFPMEKHVSNKVFPNAAAIVRNPLYISESSLISNKDYASQNSEKQNIYFPGHMRTYRALLSEPSLQQKTNPQDSSLSHYDINDKSASKLSLSAENPGYKATQHMHRTTNAPKQQYNLFKTTHYLRKRPAVIKEEERQHVTARASGTPPSFQNGTLLHGLKDEGSLHERYNWENSSSIEFYSREHFTHAEESCFQQGKVLFEKDGMCYKLLEVGPCNRDRQEWLVLDKELITNKSRGRLRAVCQHCPCCDKDFRAVFWPGDSQCHHLLRESNKLCPLPGTMLQIDPFGEGECECTKNPPHAHFESDPPEDASEMLPCYPLYGHRPCASGHILVPSDQKNVTKKAYCQQDPCASYNAQHQKHNQSMYASWEGKCYRLGTKGPCRRGDVTFNIHPVSQKPACISRTNKIVELPERCISEREKEDAECQKEVVLPTEEQYVAELLHSAEKKRRRRRRINM